MLREDQACATALILACSTSVQDAQVADWATQALFMHGGDVRPVVAAVTSPLMSSAYPSSPPYGAIPSPATPTYQPASYSTMTSPISSFNPNAISTPQFQHYEGE